MILQFPPSAGSHEYAAVSILMCPFHHLLRLAAATNGATIAGIMRTISAAARTTMRSPLPSIHTTVVTSANTAIKSIRTTFIITMQRQTPISLPGLILNGIFHFAGDPT